MLELRCLWAVHAVLWVCAVLGVHEESESVFVRCTREQLARQEAQRRQQEDQDEVYGWREMRVSGEVHVGPGMLVERVKSGCASASAYKHCSKID